MALVLEDGSGVEGANAYASAADLVADAALYGLTITEEQAELAVNVFNEWFNAQCYKGDKKYGYEINELPYPREDAYVNDVLVDDETIPYTFKKAWMIGVRLTATQDINLYAPIERGVKEESFGPFKTVYDDVRDSKSTDDVYGRMPAMISYLEPYLKCSTGDDEGIHFKVGDGYFGWGDR